MKAVRMHAYGGPEVLVYEDSPDPAPGPGQVVVKVLASGINFSDVGARRANSNNTVSDLPAIIGSEAVGPIVAVGEGVTGWQAGDLVASQGPRGCYAELVALPTEQLLRVPAGMEPAQVICGLLQSRTAYAMSYGAYAAAPGERVLVHAGAGGVGYLLIQMAKMRGAHVFATVGSDAKAAIAAEAGADQVINYSTHDFAAEVLQATGGAGVKAIYDAVGQATFEGDLKCIGNRGVIVIYGSASGPLGPVDISPLNRVGAYVTHTAARHFAPTRPEYLRHSNEVMGWVHSGKLKVRYTTYPLSRAADAHRDLEGRATTGKLVLLP